MAKEKKDTSKYCTDPKKIPCLITTDASKRGVFMGFIDPSDKFKEDIVAEEIRMAVRWHQDDMHGVLGLASMGPSARSRISPAVKRGLIKGVTAVLELSDEALVNWRKEMWEV